MSCLDATGALTGVAKALLHALEDGRPWSAPDVARATQLPLYRVRAGLRELVTEEMVMPGEPDMFRIASKGRERLVA